MISPVQVISIVNHLLPFPPFSYWWWQRVDCHWRACIFLVDSSLIFLSILMCDPFCLLFLRKHENRGVCSFMQFICHDSAVSGQSDVCAAGFRTHILLYMTRERVSLWNKAQGLELLLLHASIWSKNTFYKMRTLIDANLPNFLNHHFPYRSH